MDIVTQPQHKSLLLPGAWMITGFGKLSENPLNIGHGDLRLQTHLAELVDLDTNPDSRTAFTGNIQFAQLPIGEIARLPLNTILRDGRTIFQTQPAHPSEYLESRVLDFTRSNITVFDRFAMDSDGQAIIPFPVRWAGKLEDPELHGLLLGFGFADDPYAVVIPAIEVFRFFYATSDVLAKAFLRDDFLDPERHIWNPQKTARCNDTGKAVLWLRKKMLDADARFIARFAFDKYALHQAQQIFLHACNLAPSLYGDRYIKAVPPFEGEVLVKYHCRTIGSSTQQRTLVTRLLQCHWTPPFTELKWDRDNDGRPDPSNREERDPVHWNPLFHIPKPSEEADPQPSSLADAPPSGICAPSRLKESEITERFPDLGAIPAEKLPQENAKTRAAEKDWRPILEEAFPGSVVEGKSSAELIGPTIIEGLEKKPPCRKVLTDAVDPTYGSAAYLIILELLNRISHDGLARVEFQSVLETEAIHFGVTFNVFPEEMDGKRKAWLFVDSEKTQLRMALVAEVTHEGRTRYIIELQQKTTVQISTLVVWQRKEIRLPPGLLAQALLDCARAESASLPHADRLRIHWGRLHHTIEQATEDTSKHFLERIYAVESKVNF